MTAVLWAEATTEQIVLAEAGEATLAIQLCCAIVQHSPPSARRSGMEPPVSPLGVRG